MMVADAAPQTTREAAPAELQSVPQLKFELLRATGDTPTAGATAMRCSDRHFRKFGSFDHGAKFNVSRSFSKSVTLIRDQQVGGFRQRGRACRSWERMAAYPACRSISHRSLYPTPPRRIMGRHRSPRPPFPQVPAKPQLTIVFLGKPQYFELFARKIILHSLPHDLVEVVGQVHVGKNIQLSVQACGPDSDLYWHHGKPLSQDRLIPKIGQRLGEVVDGLASLPLFAELDRRRRPRVNEGQRGKSMAGKETRNPRRIILRRVLLDPDFKYYVGISPERLAVKQSDFPNRVHSDQPKRRYSDSWAGRC